MCIIYIKNSIITVTVITIIIIQLSRYTTILNLKTTNFLMINYTTKNKNKRGVGKVLAKDESTGS